MASFLPQTHEQPRPLEGQNGGIRRRFQVESTPFAGRIGANQEFSVSPLEEADLLRKSPDAAPLVPWSQMICPNQFIQLNIWKAAFVEGVGIQLATGPVVPSLIGGLLNTLTLPLFIFAAGPVSGGHVNPTITMATFFARLSTFPRSILYISFQLLGATVAGYLLRGSFDTRSFVIPGCFIDTSIVSVGSAFTIEVTTDFMLIFFSFSVGLDPRQREVFGPALGPIFVGIILGITSFGTGYSQVGYTGFGGNPARCFGAMVGSHFTSYHWIHWLGPIVASILHGIMYYFIPPYQYCV
ncbi:unnamed protein product [Penicillium nalgiovense]|uniref:Aquaporin n=1 Tax=Penicillium nalgiovense TaxID=60175 RepID=A0A9W4HU27_PENNA|nr:unnamed protein product [Penicillium nalgiovense]CAG7988726.1 unnamed protein product [Penicillium nalgiovense]CAG8013382.1 unnamed protein product [Penicillium nalgiovense]CAG8035977.1 unnamed protein product [Penicillium nalgiovense]CAG8046166.1 unnamed protein product [Penicillium nalgiovense]